MVCSQTTFQKEDSICFSGPDAKILIKDLKRGEICDSIMTTQQSLIEDMKSILKGYKEETDILIEQNAETERKLTVSNRKIKILGFTVKFGIPIGLATGFVLATSLK